MMPNRSNSTNVKPKASSSSKILPFLLPAHSRAMLANKDQIKLSGFQYDLRKVSTPPIIAAGATPYIAAGYLGLPAGVTKSAVTSGVSSSTLDAGGQLISNPKGDLNLKQTVGVGLVGAATAGYGSGLAKGAGVEAVPFTNVHKNTKNIPGLTIFGNQQMLNQVGSRSVKSATDDKSKPDK